MRNDLTDITMVIDRSGSMLKCREDAEGGVNAFIDEQKQAAGDAALTIYEFNDTVTPFVTGMPIKAFGKYQLRPGGWTALLDAVGIAIDQTGQRLSAMREEDRPAVVVMMIVTDGAENSSRIYTRQKIREMVEHQQNAYNWKFTFVGSDKSIFQEAESIGIRPEAIAAFNPTAPSRAYRKMSDHLGSMRISASSGVAHSGFQYSTSDRAAMLEGSK